MAMPGQRAVMPAKKMQVRPDGKFASTNGNVTLLRRSADD